MVIFYKGEDIIIHFNSDTDISTYTKVVKFFTPFSAIKTATVNEIDDNNFTATISDTQSSDLKTGTLNIVVEFSLAGNTIISKSVECQLNDAYQNGGARESISNSEFSLNFNETTLQVSFESANYGSILEVTQARDEAVQAKEDSQTILDTITNLENIGIVNANSGVATISSGTVTLTSTPPTGWLNGQYVRVSVVGAISFDGANFSSGDILAFDDKLIKISTQWFLVRATVDNVDSLLQYSGAINTFGRYLATVDLLNGATLVTDSLGNQSLLVPSGSTGQNSVIYAMNTLANSVQVAEVGACNKVYFSEVLEHTSTSNIGNILRFKGRYYVSSTATDADLSYTIIDSTHTRVWGWIAVPSNFTAITSYIQFKQTTTFSSNFSVKVISCAYFTDVQLGQSANERNRILNPDADIKKLYTKISDKTDFWMPFPQTSVINTPLNGSSISGNTLTIPSGQTGRFSTIERHTLLTAVPILKIGYKTVQLYLLTESVSNILGTNGELATCQTHIKRSGSQINNVGTVTKTRLDSTNLIVKVEYTLVTGDTELIPYFQYSGTATQASTATITWTPFYTSSDIVVPTNQISAEINSLKDSIVNINATIAGRDLYTTLTVDSYYAEVFNGATFAGSRISVATGQTGQNSYVQALISTSKIINFSNAVGKPVIFKFIVNTSSNLTDLRTLAVNAHVIRGGSQVNSVATSTSIVKISANVAQMTLTYTPQSNDTSIRPYLQITGTTTAVSDQYFELSDCFYFLSTVSDGYPNKNTYSFVQEIKGIKSSINSLNTTVSGGVSTTILTVKRDGTGSFATPKLANDSITDSSLINWYIIDFDGTYTDTEWIVKPFTIVRGRGINRSWLKGELPDNSTDAQISFTSTIWLRKTAYIENCKITAKNMRYAVHSEESGLNTDQTHNIFMCHIEHFGNQGAKDWRNANPGSGMSASTVWGSDRPWGYGASSGLVENYTDSTFASFKKEAYYVHNNKDFTKPNRNFLKNCTLSRRGTFGDVIVVESLGSGQCDNVEITGCNITKGYIKHNDNPWITEDLSKQYANHAEYKVIVANSSKIGYLDGTRGKALKIESNSILAGSSISVSGTAVASIFGDITTKNGGVSLKGYQYGYWDISGILVGISSNIAVSNTLGKRLGDCSSINKTLTVLIDGTTTVNVVFSTDLTLVSNATIISTINSALASNAVASEYNPAEGEYYPHFPDKEQLLTNTSTVGIPRFSAVTYNADSLSIKLATSSDTVIGFTLERINVGDYGRVLFEGILSKTQLGLSGTVSFGNTYVVDSSNAGKLIAGSTNIVGKAIATDWIEF